MRYGLLVKINVGYLHHKCSKMEMSGEEMNWRQRQGLDEFNFQGLAFCPSMGPQHPHPPSERACLMEPEKDWQLTVHYTCPKCGKHYIIPDWKQKPKCRVCGVELRADDHQGEPSPPAQGRAA
jgi:predicted RNA-binding Zn-ribbon protein involved in translation (DUF1610 family)